MAPAVAKQNYRPMLPHRFYARFWPTMSNWWLLSEVINRDWPDFQQMCLSKSTLTHKWARRGRLSSNRGKIWRGKMWEVIINEWLNRSHQLHPILERRRQGLDRVGRSGGAAVTSCQRKISAGALVVKFRHQTGNEVVVVADRVGWQPRLGRGIGLKQNWRLKSGWCWETAATEVWSFSKSNTN